MRFPGQLLLETSFIILCDLPNSHSLWTLKGEPRPWRIYVEVSPTAPVRAMEPITINRCHGFRGFVYEQAHFSWARSFIS